MRVWFLLMSVVTTLGRGSKQVETFSKFQKCEMKLCYNVMLMRSPLTDGELYQATHEMAGPFPNVLHKMVNFETFSKGHWDLEGGPPAIIMWQNVDDLLQFTQTPRWGLSQHR